MGIERRGLRDRWRGVRLLRPADPPLPEITVDRPLAWRTPVEAVRLIVTGATLATAARIALVVGTLLTGVNLGGVILGGRAGWVTLLQAGANYAIPYVVASLGMLSRTRVATDKPKP